MSVDRTHQDLETRLNDALSADARSSAAPSPAPFLAEVRRRAQRRMIIRLVPLAFASAAAGMALSFALTRPATPTLAPGTSALAAAAAPRELPTLASFRAIVEAGDASRAPFPEPADAGEAAREMARAGPFAGPQGL